MASLMASSTKGAMTLASFAVMPIDSIERCAELEGRNQEETRRSVERHDSSRDTIAASVIIMARILHLIAGQAGACGALTVGKDRAGVRTPLLPWMLPYCSYVHNSEQHFLMTSWHCISVYQRMSIEERGPS